MQQARTVTGRKRLGWAALIQCSKCRQSSKKTAPITSGLPHAGRRTAFFPLPFLDVSLPLPLPFSSAHPPSAVAIPKSVIVTPFDCFYYPVRGTNDFLLPFTDHSLPFTAFH